MKKSFKQIFFIFLLFLLFPLKDVFAIPSCNNFFNDLKSEHERLKLDLASTEIIDNSLGFQLMQEWNKDKDDFTYVRDEKGYVLVGKILDSKITDKISLNDKIIKINDLETSKLKSEEILKILSKEKEAKLQILRDDNLFLANLTLNNYEPISRYVTVDFKSIIVNEKDGNFDASLILKFVFDYPEDSGLWELVEKHLVYELDNGQWNTIVCTFDRNEWNKLDIVSPDDINFFNRIKVDKSLTTSEVEYFAFAKKTGLYDFNSLEVSTIDDGVMTFKNKYDLRNFPFDKQNLKIELVSSDTLPDGVLRFTDYSARNIDRLMKENSIQGWNIKDAKITYQTYQNPNNLEGFLNDKINIDLVIERKHGYYVFKIIFPIILILLVCWSAIWITPREIESRLTITIVCLLSLIAYNFVIDSDLPKLEYLTVLDYIILLSYVYATIPNFLSVYSHRLLMNKQLDYKLVEDKGRKFGFLSYLFLVFIIIFINVNFSPNTAALFNWMSIR